MYSILFESRSMNFLTQMYLISGRSSVKYVGNPQMIVVTCRELNYITTCTARCSLFAVDVCLQ